MRISVQTEFQVILELDQKEELRELVSGLEGIIALNELDTKMPVSNKAAVDKIARTLLECVAIPSAKLNE